MADGSPGRAFSSPIMSSNTVSAVLEKQIRRLCLNDFPCGRGSWRRTKNGPCGAGTEPADALLDLLNCPRSPWRNDGQSWSPQASGLRELAVREPRRHLHTDFIYNYFTTLRIPGRNVSTIDEGLSKFSKLEELVLSVNSISEISSANLPKTLKSLELRSNRLSSLSGLTSCPPPQLQYLGLGSNSLGSHKDFSHLTGRHWPKLVCLDLSDCEFQDQRALVTALKSLPCLKTLMLKGNPFTLAPAYPGFTVDSLPQLVCLDFSWISSEERYRFGGLAGMSDLIEDVASVTVSLSRLRGIPDPLMAVDKKAPDFPVVTHRYFISYQFLSHQTSDNRGGDGEAEPDAASRAAEEDSICSDLQSNTEHQGEASVLQTAGPAVNAHENISATVRLSQYRTSKLTWSDCMDLSHSLTHTVGPLGDLKRFLSQGLCLSLEEEKILSWPAASEEVPLVKPSPTTKGKKGQKDEQVKSASAKDKPKDKKTKGAPQLVQDPPIRTVLASAHIPMHSLVHGSQRVAVVCDFGPLPTDSEVEAAHTQKDSERKMKEDKKKEDKGPKQKETSSAAQKSSTASKGTAGKGKDGADHTDPSVPDQQEPATVELRVELEKWRTPSEARRLTVAPITPKQGTHEEI
uniref:Leucine rich repeat containing 43 n=1 Tax=Fundulus heteroclitus TaxID=8078 RepID=A0A3Q2NQ34_FUNHE